MLLIEEYEKDYSALVAEITALVGRVQIFGGAEKKEVCSNIDSKFTEASELLEQIGLEIHDLTPDQKQSYNSKYNCFQAELKRLQKEYDTAKKLSKQTIAIDMSEDFDDVSIQDDQRQRLLENTERIERTGSRLTQGYRLALESEQMGSQVLQDLHHQRETIQNTRNRLRETNADIGLSSRVLNSMWMRGIRDKFILYIVGAVFIIVVLISIYLSIGGGSSSSTQ